MSARNQGDQATVGSRAAVHVLRAWFEAITVAGDRYRDESRSEWAGEEFRFHERGGFWNDTSGRAAYGVTKDDVTGCRRDMRVLAKVTLKWDDVDAILTEAVATNGLSIDELKRVACRPTWNRVKRRNRREARAEGKCGICAARAPSGTKRNGTPLKTCTICRATVAESKRRRALRDQLRELAII